MAIGGIGGALLAGLEGYSNARKAEQNFATQEMERQRTRALLDEYQRGLQEQQALYKAWGQRALTEPLAGGGGGPMYAPGAGGMPTPSPTFGGGDQGAAARGRDPGGFGGPPPPAYDQDRLDYWGYNRAHPGAMLSWSDWQSRRRGFGGGDQGSLARLSALNGNGGSNGFSGSSMGGGPGIDPGAGGDDIAQTGYMREIPRAGFSSSSRGGDDTPPSERVVSVGGRPVRPGDYVNPYIHIGQDRRAYSGTERPEHRIGYVDPSLFSRGANGFSGGGIPPRMDTTTGGDFGSRQQAMIDQLVRLGVRPEVAAGAVQYANRNESRLDPNAVNPTSGALGVNQWLGPRKTALQAEYGQRPSYMQQVAFTGEELQGPERATLDRLRGATTAKEGYDIWGSSFERPGAAALAKAGVEIIPGTGITHDHPIAQGGRQILAQMLPMIDPMVQGRMSMQALHDAIERANPGAPDAVKAGAFFMGMKLLAPYEQERSRMLLEMYREAHQDEMQTRREEAAARQQTQRDADILKREQEMGWQIVTDPTTGEQYEHNPRTGQSRTLTGEPYTPGGAQKLGGPGGGGKVTSKNVEVKDAQGKILFSGSAHQDRTGNWVADKDQKKIDIPDDANIAIRGVGEGGRVAEAQFGRMLGATNQASIAIGNLAKMPQGSTLGMFQGLQAERGDSLAEGMKRTLANKVTSQTAQLMSTLSRGIGRSLATLEAQGAATGLVGLATQMQGTVPASGDTNITALGKLAEMRQIVEAAIETLNTSPRLSPEQKALLEKNLGRIKEAVPFTVSDVIALEADPDVETYGEFAKTIGLGGGGGAQQQQAPGGGTAGKTTSGIEWSLQ